MTNTTKLADKLADKLASGIVSFSYHKSNGEVRYAVGTTNPTVIPNSSSATLPTKASLQSNGTQKYYDFTKQAWRSLKVSEILRIATTVEI